MLIRKKFLILTFFLFNLFSVHFLFANEKTLDQNLIEKKCLQLKKEKYQYTKLLNIINLLTQDKKYMRVMDSLSLGVLLKINKTDKHYLFSVLLNNIKKDIKNKLKAMKNNNNIYCNKMIINNKKNENNFLNIKSNMKKNNNVFIVLVNTLLLKIKNKNYINENVCFIPNYLKNIIDLFYKDKINPVYLKYLQVYCKYLETDFKNKKVKNFLFF